MPHEHYYFKHAREVPLSLSPEIIYTGVLSDAPHWYNVRHQHDFCELLFVAGGKGSADVDGVRWPLEKGALVLLNPGVPHEERSDPDEPLLLIFLALRGLRLPGQPENCLLPAGDPPVLSCGEYSYKMGLYFQELLQESSRQVPFYEQIAASLVSAILVLILRLLCIQPEGERPLGEECRRIKQYLDENYTSPITLGKLSETVYISKHYLSHLFKEQTGTSPIKYLTTKRISLACGLLRSTDAPISEIARQVGYENPLYFSQVFKKIVGMPPLEYRSHG